MATGAIPSPAASAASGQRPAVRDLLRDVRPGDRWLVAVAHPDDEAFGCGSVIARAASLGAAVTVACATRGEAGEPHPRVAEHGDLGGIREAELRRSAAVLGVETVLLLGYRDSGFDGPAGPGTLAAAPVDSVAGVLLRLVTDLRPDVVVVLDGSDGHRDHQQLRAAMRTALGLLPAPRPAMWEHTLPSSIMLRWLAETSASRGDDAYHAPESDSFGRPDAEVTDVLDVREFLAQREAAIAAHRSQSSPFDGLSDELRTAFLGTDHLVRVRLPAAGPVPEPRPAPVAVRPAADYWDCTTARWRPCPQAG